MISVLIQIILIGILVFCIINKKWELIILPILGTFILCMVVGLSATAYNDEEEFKRMGKKPDLYEITETIPFTVTDGFSYYNEFGNDIRWETYGENNGNLRWRYYSENEWHVVWIDSEYGKIAKISGLIIRNLDPTGTWHTERVIFDRKPGLWQPIPRHNMKVIIHTKE
jgi:hypothetical protein